MCLSPVPISTVRPGYRQIVGSRGSMLVPCGHCPECLQARVDSLYQRCYLEYQHTVTNGGYAYWDTLTLDDDHMEKIDGKFYIPRRSFTLFMKRLRKRLEKVAPGSSKLLKFFVVEENLSHGHDARPHLHIVFFVLSRDLPYWLLRKVIKDSWKQGFIDSMYTVGQRVLYSPAAIRYICKYITKWFEFTQFQDPEVNRLYRPFYQCSLNMGCYDDYDFSSPLKILTKNGYDYQDPGLFYVNKLGRDKLTDASGNYIRTPKGSYMYKINDYGIYMRLKNFEKVLNNKANDIIKMYCRCSSDVKDHIDLLMRGRDSHHLATYLTVYRGIRYSTMIDMPCKFNNLKQDYLAILTCQNQQVDASLSDSPLHPDTDQQHIKYICSDDVPGCRDFDHVYDLLLSGQDDRNWYKIRADSDKLHSINRLKSIYYV